MCLTNFWKHRRFITFTGFFHGEENRGEAQEAAWQDYDRFNLTRNQLNQERTKRAEAFKNGQLEQANNLREAQLIAQDARKRDGREEAAWEQIQENRLAAANETLPEEVGRDGPTEALWKAKDRLQTTQPQKASTAETGNGEFSTASTAPGRDSDRWGVKFDPNETAKFLFGDGILSQPMAIPDASSRGKTQVTPQMAQQVQALEQVYSTRDPRLIPGNPQFDMFAFADYLLGLRAKNQALYQQRMGGAMQGGYAGAQAPQISPEMMAEYQGQLSEAKQLGLQGGIDRYGNRVFYDPRTKRIFKSIAEYKQSISTSNPSAAPSAGERSGMGTD